MFMTSLKLEIIQERPFASTEEEALLNLIRTTDTLQRLFQKSIKPWGITSTQYNVLRILRGVHPEGLTCSAIGGRMITAEPDITRLLTRLKALGVIRQQRDDVDRRIVWTYITASGLQLLDQMADTIAQLPTDLLGHLTAEEVQTLIRILEAARLPHLLNPCVP